ncbi:MAG TPA: hypothetical protein VHB27_10555 [Rhodopila sp.]|uniref:hypothetical protein n=1 Tax=Rhodopila sp. TaxID=2480087 RepID=UPI002C31771E|nr:hypothetical protein [Rhodopila sp.]HVY15663.1 hypothetical protein [Rhodopila sp.]
MTSRLDALQAEVTELRQALAARGQGNAAPSGHQAAPAPPPAGTDQAQQTADNTQAAENTTDLPLPPLPPSLVQAGQATGQTKGKDVQFLPPPAPIQVAELPPPNPATLTLSALAPATLVPAAPPPSIAAPSKAAHPNPTPPNPAPAAAPPRPAAGPFQARTDRPAARYAARQADDGDSTEAVLARLRQSASPPPHPLGAIGANGDPADVDFPAAAAPWGEPPPAAPGPAPSPVPSPTPSPAPASPVVGRLRAARADLSAGRIEAARRQLQQVQLSLVFRPAGEDSWYDAGAANVGRALGALGQEDVRGSASFVDRAIADLTRPPGTLAPPAPAHELAGGYAPAYPPR